MLKVVLRAVTGTVPSQASISQLNVAFAEAEADEVDGVSNLDRLGALIESLIKKLHNLYIYHVNLMQR